MKILFNTYPTAFFRMGGGERQLLDYKDSLINCDTNTNVDLFNQWDFDISKYDIVHIFGVISENIAFMDNIFNDFDSVPIVISPNFWIDIEKWKVDGIFENIKKMLWMSDIIIVNSFIEEEYMVRNLQIDSSKIAVVHNKYNDIFLEYISPNLFKDKFNINDKFILNVANVETRKNQLAFLKVLKEFPNYKFVIIGNIREKWYYEACREIAGDQLIYIPMLGNDDPLLRSAYSGCEFFAMPSLVETPSISALEAAVSGAKILITDLGSTKEYFNDLVEYVNPYDQDSMKTAITNSIENVKTKKLMNYIRKNFSSLEIYNELQNTYKRAINVKKVNAL